MSNKPTIEAGKTYLFIYSASGPGLDRYRHASGKQVKVLSLDVAVPDDDEPLFEFEVVDGATDRPMYALASELRELACEPI